MAKKRIHEIAKEQGLSSKDVLDKLLAAGLDVKAAASSVEETDALRALGRGNGAGTATATPAAATPPPGAPGPPAPGCGARGARPAAPPGRPGPCGRPRPALTRRAVARPARAPAP